MRNSTDRNSIVEGVAGQMVRRAEGPGMTVGVTGATLQGSVDRQRADYSAVAGSATSRRR